MKHPTRTRIGPLRERARRAIAEGQRLETSLPDDLDVQDALHLLEELRIYQAELEIQNDELCQAQGETARALEKYRQLFAGLPLPAILVDGAGTILEVNAQAASGLDLDARRRRSVLSLFEHADALALRAALRDRNDPGPRTLARLALPRRAATPLVCDVLILHPRGETERPDYSLLLLVDRGAELALAASEERWRELSRRLAEVIRATDIGTWEWNVQTGAVILNERWAGMLGYRLDDLEPIGIQTWIDLAHPDDLPRSNERLARCFAGELDTYECEARMRHRDGHWVWVLDRGRVVEWTGDGQPLRMSGTHLDITERRLREEQLRAAMEAAETANRAKSAFLANMSHEIRTPLNAVLGFCHLLRQRVLDGESQALARRIQDSGRLLLSLINDILDFSRIEAGRLELEPLPLHLPSLLLDLGVLFDDAARRKGLDLRIGEPPAVADLIGDARRLKQVLINLLGNAIKFTERGEVALTVTLENLDDGLPGRARLRFAVRDTGIGIPPEQQAAVFAAFSQADVSINRRFGGSGLGLSISQQILRLMGATLRVDSAPGVGSTFWFVLELARDPRAADTDRPSGPEPAPSLAGRRVLVVDDSEINRDLAARLLADAGATVALAADGQAALDWLAAAPGPPDIVLMDVQMPGLDGHAATRRIRQEPRWRDLPIVALTAGAFQAMREAARAAGMNDCVTKPFEAAQLLACVARWTGGRADLSSSGATREAAASVPDAATPDLAGLAGQGVDVPAALARWKEPERYRVYLAKFHDVHAGDAQAIAAAIQRGALSDAAGLAHRLAGVAATLALPRVAMIARHLERSLKAGEAVDPACLQVLREAIDEVCGGIRAWIGVAPAPRGPDAPDRAACGDRLGRLLTAIAEQDLDGAESLLGQLRGGVPDDRLAALRSHLADFDFGAAESLARALLADAGRS